MYDTRATGNVFAKSTRNEFVWWRKTKTKCPFVTISFFLKKTFIFYFYVICFVTAHGNRNYRRVLYNTFLINFTFKCPRRRARPSGGYTVLRPSLLCFGLCAKCSDDVERLYRVFFFKSDNALRWWVRIFVYFSFPENKERGFNICRLLISKRLFLGKVT